MVNNYKKFMDRAILLSKQNKSEIPVGCVIVRNNQIIAESCNAVEEQSNPLMHAEIIAINKALNVVKSKYLSECYMFCTLEPCNMCKHAIKLVRIKTLIFGAYASKKVCINNHEVFGGVQETKCAQIISEFFLDKR